MVYTKCVKDKKKYKDVTLPELAAMIEALAQATAEGFGTTEEKFNQVQLEFDDLGDRIDRHMGDVRRQTDAIARRVKKVELTVFGVGK